MKRTSSSRDRLVSAAAQQLWERGYAAASPRLIQRAARAGQGSMYHHFAGKADVALAAIESMAAELEAEAARTLDGPGEPIERIEAYLFKKRDALAGCRLGRLAGDHEVVGNPALLKPLNDFFSNLQADLVAVLGEMRLPDPIPPDGVATMLVAVIQGGYVLARARQQPQLLDEAVHTAATLLRQTLLL